MCYYECVEREMIFSQRCSYIVLLTIDGKRKADAESPPNLPFLYLSKDYPYLTVEKVIGESMIEEYLAVGEEGFGWVKLFPLRGGKL